MRRFVHPHAPAASVGEQDRRSLRWGAPGMLTNRHRAPVDGAKFVRDRSAGASLLRRLESPVLCYEVQAISQDGVWYAVPPPCARLARAAERARRISGADRRRGARVVEKRRDGRRIVVWMSERRSKPRS